MTHFYAPRNMFSNVAILAQYSTSILPENVFSDVSGGIEMEQWLEMGEEYQFQSLL